MVFIWHPNISLFYLVLEAVKPHLVLCLFLPLPISRRSKISLGSKALSHDSVFVSDSSEANEALGASQDSIHGKVKSLQVYAPAHITRSTPFQAGQLRLISCVNKYLTIHVSLRVMLNLCQVQVILSRLTLTSDPVGGGRKQKRGFYFRD